MEASFSACLVLYLYTMGQLVAQLVTWATAVIAALGYAGIAVLIALESVFPPIPSEVILPLSGSLSASGTFNVWMVLLSSILGSVVGASMLYSIGRFAGERRIGAFLDRYGKWLLLSRDDLDRSRVWFARYGNIAVLIARVVPGMRSIVSIPAGLSEMHYGRFCLFTALGSGVWNGGLVWAGYFLGKNWNAVEGWLAPLGPIVYGFIFLLLGTFVARRLWSRYGPPARRSVGE